MLVKTKLLTGAALDWAVAQCERLEEPFKLSTHWRRVEAINKREGILWIYNGIKGHEWMATKNFSDPNNQFFGPKIHIACMRLYVHSKLGEEIDVPDRFMKTTY